MSDGEAQLELLPLREDAKEFPPITTWLCSPSKPTMGRLFVVEVLVPSSRQILLLQPFLIEKLFKGYLALWIYICTCPDEEFAVCALRSALFATISY